MSRRSGGVVGGRTGREANALLNAQEEDDGVQ